MATGRAGRKEQGGVAAPAKKPTTRKGKAAPAAEEQPVKAPVAQEQPAAEQPQAKKPQVDPSELNEHGQYLGKYAHRQRRADEAGTQVDPDWRWRHTVLEPGTPPRSETSVMAVVWKIAKEAGSDGITGEQLAVKLRHTPNIASRSKYTVGLPPVGWSEDYVSAALSHTPGILRISQFQPAKAEDRDDSKEAEQQAEAE